MVLQIQRKKVDSDPDTRIYFSRVQLTQIQHALIVGLTDAEIEAAGGSDPMLDMLLGLPGVMRATTTPYACVISKAPVYGWDEIEPKLLSILTAWNLDLEQSNLTKDL